MVFSTPCNSAAASGRPRRRLAWAAAVLALLAGLTGMRAVHAAGSIAADLQQVISVNSTPKLNWVKDVKGVRYVKVLVVAKSQDPELAALRADVLARGGSVYCRYTSVSAGQANLDRMIVLARAGDGLNQFINRAVKKRYSERLA